jgi:hypothetical protein
LTDRWAIARTKPHIVLLDIYTGCDMHRSSDKHLACGDRMNLNYGEVTAITGDYDMTIITLYNLYSVLSVGPIVLMFCPVWVTCG